jgi:hypothetical protein
MIGDIDIIYLQEYLSIITSNILINMLEQHTENIDVIIIMNSLLKDMLSKTGSNSEYGAKVFIKVFTKKIGVGMFKYIISLEDLLINDHFHCNSLKWLSEIVLSGNNELKCWLIDRNIFKKLCNSLIFCEDLDFINSINNNDEDMNNSINNNEGEMNIYNYDNSTNSIDLIGKIIISIILHNDQEFDEIYDSFIKSNSESNRIDGCGGNNKISLSYKNKSIRYCIEIIQLHLLNSSAKIRQVSSHLLLFLSRELKENLLVQYESFLSAAVNGLGDSSSLVRKLCSQSLRYIIPLAPLLQKENNKCKISKINNSDGNVENPSLQSILVGCTSLCRITENSNDCEIINYLKKYTNLVSNESNKIDVNSNVTANNNLNKSSLREYQWDGITWIRELTKNRFGCILADDMGLGFNYIKLFHLIYFYKIIAFYLFYIKLLPFLSILFFCRLYQGKHCKH